MPGVLIAAVLAAFRAPFIVCVVAGAAVAGLGSLWGVLLGAAFIALLPTLSASAPLIGSAHGQDVVFGLFVIAVMILLPTGVAGLIPRLRRLRAKA